MNEPRRRPTDAEAEAAANIACLDPDLFDEEPTERSFDIVEAMPEEEFIEVAEDALPWLTDEQKAMLRRNR